MFESTKPSMLADASSDDDDNDGLIIASDDPDGFFIMDSEDGDLESMILILDDTNDQVTPP